mgnify:CR=1 FL=1
MANLICVLGESGSGKTTGCRNLDPKTTVYIDCDKKGLSWRRWRADYNRDNGNYIATDNGTEVLNALRYVNAEKPDVSCVVVDTLNGIMVADESRRRKEKGYDKWDDLAWSVWDTIDEALTMRDDLTIVFLAHAQTTTDDNGYRFTHMKTSGRKLDKLVPESKFTYVFLCKRIEGRYVLVTQSDSSTAKGGYMLFDDTVDNDLLAAIEKIRDFEGLPPLDYGCNGSDPAHETAKEDTR